MSCIELPNYMTSLCLPTVGTLSLSPQGTPLGNFLEQYNGRVAFVRHYGAERNADGVLTLKAYRPDVQPTVRSPNLLVSFLVLRADL